MSLLISWAGVIRLWGVPGLRRVARLGRVSRLRGGVSWLRRVVWLRGRGAIWGRAVGRRGTIRGGCSVCRLLRRVVRLGWGHAVRRGGITLGRRSVGWGRCSVTWWRDVASLEQENGHGKLSFSTGSHSFIQTSLMTSGNGARNPSKAVALAARHAGRLTGGCMALFLANARLMETKPCWCRVFWEIMVTSWRSTP